MNADSLLAHFDRISAAPGAVPRLRRFILDLAVRGKLVEQDPSDEPASELLKRIQKEKARLAKEGKGRKDKLSVPLLDDDLPFSISPRWQWSQLATIGFISPRNDVDGALLASFVPMRLIPAEYGSSHSHEVRPWHEIKSGYTHFAEGDVGLAKITPCFENGKSTIFRGLTGGIGAGTTELHIVRPLLINADYVLLFLKCPHFIETGVPRMTGTAGQKRVSAEYFAYSPFPLPPLAEQHRIVAKVAELMALCNRLAAAQAERESRRDRVVAASLHRLNNGADTESFREHARFHLRHLPRLTTRPEHVQQLRQNILNLAVRGRLVPQDCRDEPASILLDRLKADAEAYCEERGVAPPLPGPINQEALSYPAPPGWSWTRLCALCKVITDGDHQPPPKSEDGIAFLTIGNIATGRLDFSNCRFVSKGYLESVADYKRPSRGDILYTVVGATYGRSVFVDTNRQFCVQRHIAILKPASGVDVRFLCYLLASPLVYEQATLCTTGIAQPTIPLRPLRNFLVPLPPVAEQHRIVAKVDELLTLCDRLVAQFIATESDNHRLLEGTLSQALAA